MARTPKTIVRPDGQRFIQTADRDWCVKLAEWQGATMARHMLLEPIFRRAARTNQWSLYNVAKRASYARVPPCPMPWGHVIFGRRARP